MFKTLSILPEYDAFFKIHPFKKTPQRKPFTMVGASRRNQKSPSLIYLNHHKKLFYAAPVDKVSYYEWAGANSTHRLYFIAGVDGVFTVLHKNMDTGVLKVPCCYANPDYYASGKDPEFASVKIMAYLQENGWTYCRINGLATEEERNDIMACVNIKLTELGWAKGRYF